MKKHLLLFLASIFYFLFTCQCLHAQDEATYSLEGKINLEGTGKKPQEVMLYLYEGIGTGQKFSMTGKKTTTDVKGFFYFTLNSSKDYMIVPMADGLYGSPLTMPKNNVRQGQKVSVNLPMIKEPSYSLSCTYIDLITMEWLEGVKATLKNKLTGISIEAISDSKGNCFFVLEGNTEYILDGYKDLYFIPAQNSITTEQNNPLRNVELKIQLEKMWEGKTKKLQHFGFGINSSEVGLELAQELEGLVDFLKNNPSTKIEILTHTDSRGDDDYNLQLSEDRAANIKAYLIEKGVDFEQLDAKGYGESMLTNQCEDGTKCSGEQHAENRRVEYKILGTIEKK